MQGKKIKLLDYSKIRNNIDPPNFLDIQKKSYQKFLQKDIPPEKRQDVGLHKVFKDVFPIQDFTGSLILNYINYSIKEPKYSALECGERGSTYAAPLEARISLYNKKLVYKTVILGLIYLEYLKLIPAHNSLSYV